MENVLPLHDSVDSKTSLEKSPWCHLGIHRHSLAACAQSVLHQDMVIQNTEFMKKT